MSSPAGWYPQPNGQLMYWDGHSWTQHVAPAGVQASAAAPKIDPVAHEPTLNALGSVHHRVGRSMKTVKSSNAQYFGRLPGPNPRR
jgi:hypothetical protein